MNLRKDHSHMFQTNSCEFFCEGLGEEPSRVPHADAQGWWGRAGPSSSSFLLPRPSALLFVRVISCMASVTSCSQLSAMDVSVRSTMKGAAKCDKHCELQNSVNRQGLERILCFWDIPESMPASVSMLCCSSRVALSLGTLL